MSKKTNILIVDDEQIVLDSIHKLVRNEPYAVFTAYSAREALDELKKTDIMVTGYATINTALQATQLGAFDYIAKPFSKKELLGVLKRAAELVAGNDYQSGGTDEAAPR